MDTYSELSAQINSHIKTIESMRGKIIPKIDLFSDIICKSLKDGGTIYFCGNGGSAADSQHLAAEFVGRFKSNRRPLKSIALTTDSSILTCIANDFSFDEIFSRQVKGLCNQGDILVCISTSGKSQNILNAIKQAKSMNVEVICLLGNSGGSCNEICENKIVIDSHITAIIQEIHIMIGHLLIDIVEKKLVVN